MNQRAGFLLPENNRDNFISSLIKFHLNQQNGIEQKSYIVIFSLLARTLQKNVTTFYTGESKHNIFARDV